MAISFARILLNMRSLRTALVLILALIILPFIPAAADTPILHLKGQDMAPSTIYIGEAHSEELDDIVMLQITITTTHQEEVNITSIMLHRTGLASDADVESLDLYLDGNANSQLDPMNDSLLSTAQFVLGKAEFSVQRTLDSSTPMTLLVVLSISSQATSGGTIGVDIPNEDYIDTKIIADFNFHLHLGSENSTIMLDTDGDLNPDITDPDDDNDGYSDDVEIQSNSDFKDSTALPKDTDKDYVPDSIDTDDDNDGEPDEYDDFPLDDSRQRDYTVVYFYTIIVAVLIIVMIFLGLRGRPSGKPKALDEELLLKEDDEDEFDISVEDDDLEGDVEESEGKDEMLENEGD
ncbi:MAG: hypothetical protein JSV09_06055 [Thermoplasmata archaeon]|nr:MAG: hypothetical protein JSV09_06055 [Thermoplasmata archaeon]